MRAAALGQAQLMKFSAESLPALLGDLARQENAAVQESECLHRQRLPYLGRQMLRALGGRPWQPPLVRGTRKCRTGSDREQHELYMTLHAIDPAVAMRGRRQQRI